MGSLKSTNLPFSRCHITSALIAHYDNTPFWIPAVLIRMTLNDLECPIHLKVRLLDGTLDVRLLRVSDSTIRIGVARGGGGGVGWTGGSSPPPCGQLTRCFSAVAELLVTRGQEVSTRYIMNKYKKAVLSLR